MLESGYEIVEYQFLQGEITYIFKRSSSNGRSDWACLFIREDNPIAQMNWHIAAKQLVIQSFECALTKDTLNFLAEQMDFELFRIRRRHWQSGYRRWLSKNKAGTK